MTLKRARDARYRTRHPERVAAAMRAASARYRATRGAAYTVADRLYRRRRRAIERLGPGGQAAIQAAERALRSASTPEEIARCTGLLGRLERVYGLAQEHDPDAEVHRKLRVPAPVQIQPTNRSMALAEREAAEWRERIAREERGMAEPD